MNVKLDNGDRRRVEEFARKSGKPPEEVVRELVHEALQGRDSVAPKGEEARIRKQRQAMDALLSDLDRTGEREPQDGLSGSIHHDRFLFGEGRR